MKKFLLNSKPILILLVIMNLSFANSLLAKSTTWNKTTGGAWGTAGNWTNGVPAANDDVIINSDQSANITGVPTITLNSLSISGTCFLAGSVSPAVISITTTFLVGGGKIVQVGPSAARIEITIAATGTATINGTLTLDPGTGSAHPYINNGTTIIASAGLINGDGGFTQGATGVLKIGSTAGISATGASGNIQVTGTITFPVTATYVYNGTAAQTTGTGLPTGLTGTVEINNPGFTVTLNNAETIANTGSVLVTAGTFAAGTNLTMASTSGITIDGGSVTGTFQGAGVYDVFYIGSSKTAGIELVNGGLRNVSVNLTSGQTLTLNANRSPDGNLSVGSGIFDLSTFTINRSAAGGTLTVSNGAALKIGGTNSFPGSYTTHTLGTTSSTVEYGGTAQTVSTESYANLIVSGSGNKTLAATTTATGTLTLTAGNLVIPTGMTLTLSTANAIGGTGKVVTQFNTGTGAQGFIRVNAIPANSSYTLPINDGTNDLPVTLTLSAATVQANNSFTVAAFNGITGNGQPNGTAFTAAQKLKVVDAVWTINYNGAGTPTQGAGNTTIVVGWPASLEGTSFSANPNPLIGIAHYGPAAWGTSVGSGDNVANTATRTGVTSFSPFAVGTIDPGGAPLAIQVGYFNASKGNMVNTLNWSAACNSAQATFEIERSADGRTFTTINSITASQARCALPFTYDDASPLAGTNFYRIKIIDIDGRVSYTSTVKVGAQQKDMVLAGVLPNPVSNTAQLNITTSKKDKVELAVVSLEGKVVYNNTVQVQAGSSIVSIDATNFAKGAYLIRGVFSNGEISTVKFIKQ